MITLSRRTFLGGSGALVFAGQPSLVWAADGQECVLSYVPASLTINCAARRNYQAFRNFSDRVYLAGLVSLVNFTGQYGQYSAGTLFLFPILRPAREQPKQKPGEAMPEITGLIPQTATLSMQRPPFPAGQTEESLLNVLEPKGSAQSQFLGFRVDVPADDARSKLSRFTEGKLPDGKSVRIEWTVSNLNRRWFAGNPTIPHDETCSGASWRKVIIEGLKQATVSQCA